MNLTTTAESAATNRSLRGALAAATERLALAGVPSPRVDAELLAAHLLGVARSRLPLVDRLDGTTAATYAALVDRRAGRVPLQYLTGRAGFRRVELAVGPGVFVPRPETELLVGWCIRALPAAGVVVDLGAGSGAIAVAVAVERPDARVYAVEREPAAWGWLVRNIAGTAVRARHGDLATALPELAGKVDVVLSNPPYLPEDRAGELPPEVRDHEPAAALWGGPDGLTVVRVVESAAGRLLRPGGRLGVEHDDRHGDAVPGLLAAANRWDEIVDHPDLTGRPRFATARRAGPA